MLSILIPTYNRNPRSLVEMLLKQSRLLPMPIEIIVAEDGSEPSMVQQNEGLRQLEGVKYLVQPHNIGRSAIRNLLAREASFDYLLFLDCDSGIERTGYLDQYVRYIDKKDVVYGGTTYQPQQLTKDNNLHYHFGIEREALSLKNRAKNPWLNFKTNNFLVRKSILLQHPFDESIKGYGYEDVVFAEDLRKNCIEVDHIDNPVVHEGLETNDIFLQKTEESVKNLAKLVREKKLGSTRLTAFYDGIKWLIQLVDALIGIQHVRNFALTRLKQGQGGNLLFSALKLAIYHEEQKSLPKIR